MYGDVLGVDYGGVICSRVETGGRFLPIEGAFEALRRLRPKFDKVVLVSRVDAGQDEKIVRWLNWHRFWQQTGISDEDLYFCAKRSDKAAICRRLQVTHFVDDRSEVLWHLREDVNNLYLFQGEKRKWSRAGSSCRE
jgi:hypothetical protein